MGVAPPPYFILNLWNMLHHKQAKLGKDMQRSVDLAILEGNNIF